MILLNVSAHKVRGAVFGAAVADAVGVPYEFKSREEMTRSPAVGMVGGGTYHMPAGTWSDDTAMILCTLDRLDETLDYDAVMKAFLSWVNDGDYTPNGSCFDIGITTRRALSRYARGCPPLQSGLTEERSNGNGSLMRIIPAALYADAHGLSDHEAVKLSDDLSSLTHAHPRARLGCGIFTFIALELLKAPDSSSVFKGIARAADYYSSAEFSREAAHYDRILSPGFADIKEERVRSSGYVVDTLECAVWSLLNTDSYRDCVLRTVNFGNDTDTAACVAGALAGILYGLDSIPLKWRSLLIRAESLDAVISGFCQRNNIC